MRLARLSRDAGAVALLALGALLLHQLRYLLAFGGAAGRELEATGHGYLELAIPFLAVGAAAALIVSVVAPALLRRAPNRAPEWCATERAAGYTAALLAVHLTQEVVEGALVAGHGGPLTAALGAGSFVVLPLAIVLGALASFTRGWLRRVERRLASAWEDALPRPARRSDPSAPRAPWRPLSSLGLRFGIACRPPPLHSGA